MLHLFHFNRDSNIHHRDTTVFYRYIGNIKQIYFPRFTNNRGLFSIIILLLFLEFFAVSFDEIDYTVSETASSVTVCVLLLSSEEFSEPITVFLTTADSTAIGEFVKTYDYICSNHSEYQCTSYHMLWAFCFAKKAKINQFFF